MRPNGTLERAYEAGREGGRPFYSDTSTSLDFFITTKAFNEGLLSNENYAALLGVTGPNLLFKTGSRAVKDKEKGLLALHQPIPPYPPDSE